MFLAANHKPKIYGQDRAIWRRVRLIPCVVRFDAPDPTLGDALRGDRPGILAWLVEGCRRWQPDGLAPPASILAATADYQRESDTLGEFFDHACEHAPEAWLAAGELFEHYRTWCRQQGFTNHETLDRHHVRPQSRRERLSSEKVGPRKHYVGVARRPL